MKTWLIGLVCVALWLVFVSPCDAGPRMRSVLVRPAPRRIAVPSQMPEQRVDPVPPRASLRPYTPADYYRDAYPKYYGGFHARYFDNYGSPSGDIGLRGNSLYWTPW